MIPNENLRHGNDGFYMKNNDYASIVIIKTRINKKIVG
jgi:hypothetical protein